MHKNMAPHTTKMEECDTSTTIADKLAHKEQKIFFGTNKRNGTAEKRFSNSFMSFKSFASISFFFP
jgi:hypothetical protein